jgi:hypothetical protein
MRVDDARSAQFTGTGKRRRFSPARRTGGDPRLVAGKKRSGALANRDADLVDRIDLFR